MQHLLVSTFDSGAPTLPDELRTYGDYNGYDVFAHGPWRSPGAAPIYRYFIMAITNTSWYLY